MSAMLALTSCNDFLDKYPKYGVDPESEVTNEIAVALTTACYKTLQSSNMYNQRIWSLDIIAGNSEVGAGGGTDGLETVQASNFIPRAITALPCMYGVLRGLGSDVATSCFPICLQHLSPMR